MYNDLNKVIILGSLVMKPKVLYTDAGYPICIMLVNVKSHSKNDEKYKSNLVKTTILGKYGEFCGGQLDRDSKVLIEGRLSTHIKRLENKDYHLLEVLASHVYFLDKKEEEKDGSWAD